MHYLLSHHTHEACRCEEIKCNWIKQIRIGWDSSWKRTVITQRILKAERDRLTAGLNLLRMVVIFTVLNLIDFILTVKRWWVVFNADKDCPHFVPLMLLQCCAVQCCAMQCCAVQCCAVCPVDIISTHVVSERVCCAWDKIRSDQFNYDKLWNTVSLDCCFPIFQ